MDLNNPLLFWVAYIKIKRKYHYLGDGKGNIRIFKNEAALTAYLDTIATPEERGQIHTQEIQGKIAVPENIGFEGTLIPMTTFARDEIKPASQMLKEYYRLHRN